MRCTPVGKVGIRSTAAARSTAARVAAAAAGWQSARIFREDTQWAIAGNVETAVLETLMRQLPKELQGEGSRVVSGNDGFAALLVFGDLPSETLARRLLATVTPVYLLDFDNDAPVTLKLDRRKTRITETRVGKHPASFLEERGILGLSRPLAVFSAER